MHRLQQAVYSHGIMHRSAFVFCSGLLLLGHRPAVTATPEERADIEVVRKAIRQHCFDCHDSSTAKGDRDLEKLPLNPADRGVRKNWVLIHDRVQQHEMPPKADSMPPDPRGQFLQSLNRILFAVDRADILSHGRGSLRRLNRHEYQDNLRDLLKLPDLEVMDRLPADRDARGFTKVTRLLDMSRV